MLLFSAHQTKHNKGSYEHTTWKQSFPRRFNVEYIRAVFVGRISNQYEFAQSQQ